MCGPVGPGSIQTRSKRQGRCHWSCAASQARAARIRDWRLRGPTASRALPRLPGPRVLTSTKTRVSPSRQTRSSSSGPLRQLRARMRMPRACSNVAAASSPARPRAARGSPPARSSPAGAPEGWARRRRRERKLTAGSPVGPRGLRPCRAARRERSAGAGGRGPDGAGPRNGRPCRSPCGGRNHSRDGAGPDVP